jgi:hypothetical protein
MSESEWPYIVAAYAVTWIALCGFALYVTVRGRAAKQGTLSLED